MNTASERSGVWVGNWSDDCEGGTTAFHCKFSKYVNGTNSLSIASVFISIEAWNFKFQSEQFKLLNRQKNNINSKFPLDQRPFFTKFLSHKTFNCKQSKLPVFVRSLGWWVLNVFINVINQSFFRHFSLLTTHNIKWKAMVKKSGIIKRK